MRVLTVGNLYPPHHLGGYELVWQAAVGALREAGHEVRVLCTDHREGAAGPDEPDVHRDLRWYWRDHAFPRMSAREVLALERWNARVWRRHVSDFRPDVVSWWAMGGMPLSLTRRWQGRALYWVNDDWPAYAPEVDRWSRLVRRGPRAAGRWIFCSTAQMRSMLAACTWLPPNAARAELQGVAPVFSPHPPADWSWRLAYVGRIDERKGIGVAIEALAHLPEATLTVTGAGDPREARRLREMACGHGVADRVTFAEPVPRDGLSDVYAAADAIVFPVTWFEPFGLVPLEAMAVGRPVLATGMGGSGDYLRDGENALLHPPGDAAALAASVRRLAFDAALCERLRAGGASTAAELTEARWLAAVVREHEAL